MRGKRWSIVLAVAAVLAGLSSVTATARADGSCDTTPTAGAEPRHPYLDADQTDAAAAASVYGYSHNPYVYSLYVPTNLPDGPVPLVVGLHGLGNSARDFEGKGLQALADRKGLIVAIPSGLRSWWATEDSLDVKWVRDVVADVRVERCIDATRIYAVGASNGGFMAQRLACDASDLFAAVVNHAGTSVDTTYPFGGPCRADPPVPILFSYGELDGTVSYETGRATLRHWVDRYRCDTQPVGVETTPWGPIERFANCGAGAEVELPFLTLLGHDHLYPNGCGGVDECAQPGPPFPTADEFNDLAFAFLARHPRSSPAGDQPPPDPSDVPLRDPQRHAGWLTRPDHGPAAELTLVDASGAPQAASVALASRVVRVEYVVHAPAGYPDDVLDRHPQCPSTSPGSRRLRYAGRPVTLRVTDPKGNLAEHVALTQTQPGSGTAVATFAVPKPRHGRTVVEVTADADHVRSPFLCTAKAARLQATVER